MSNTERGIGHDVTLWMCFGTKPLLGFVSSEFVHNGQHNFVKILFVLGGGLHMIWYFHDFQFRGYNVKKIENTECYKLVTDVLLYVALSCG